MGREVLLRVKRPRDVAAAPHLLLPWPRAKRPRGEAQGPDVLLAAQLEQLTVGEGCRGSVACFQLLHTLPRLPGDPAEATHTLQAIQQRRSGPPPAPDGAEGPATPAPVALVKAAHFPAPADPPGGPGGDPMRQWFRVVDAAYATLRAGPAEAMEADDTAEFDIYYCAGHGLTPQDTAAGVKVEGFSYDWRHEYADSSSEEESEEEVFSSEDDERERVLAGAESSDSDDDPDDPLFPVGDGKKDCNFYAYDSDLSADGA
eukprot:EG_transcript_21834